MGCSLATLLHEGAHVLLGIGFEHRVDLVEDGVVVDGMRGAGGLLDHLFCTLLRAFPPAHLRKSRNAITDVQQSGDLGWVLFDVATHEVPQPGEPAVERLSRVALLCRRHEGSWHIWRDVDGPSPDTARMRELLG